MDIGVDFGTTFSTVALVATREKVSTLEFSGSDLVPTVIFITKSMNYYLGDVALSKHAENISNSLDSGWLFKDIKRWVGVNKFNFAVVNEKLKKREYAVVLSEDYQVSLGGVGISTSPLIKLLDLISLFFLGITSEISSQFGTSVNNIVCTVPADYSSYKRSFIVEATRNSKHKISVVVNEPTAAALYNIIKDKKGNTSVDVLVYDFGGGTFDVSYIGLYGGAAAVLDTAGDLFLGGRDIDSEITKIICERLNSNFDPNVLPQASDIKINVNNRESLEDHNVLINGKIRTVKFTYNDLFEVVRPFAERSFEILKDVMLRNSLVEKGVTVVLVGGSSALKPIRQMISKLRGIKNVSFDPESFRIAVAVGAKVVIDSITDNKGLTLVDTLAHPILDEVKGLRSIVIVGKGQTVPCVAKETYSFGSGELIVPIYEGTHPITFMNEPTYFSKINLNNVSSVELTYKIAMDGTLTVSYRGKVLENLFMPKSNTDLSKYVYLDPNTEYRESSVIAYANDLNRVLDHDINLNKTNIGNICAQIDELVSKHS